MLALEPVRPGLTAKGSFKNSKSEGITIFYFHHMCNSGLQNNNINFIGKCVTGKCIMAPCCCCYVTAVPPSFLSMLYSLAMFFCFFSKFRFIRKKCVAGLPTSITKIWCHCICLKRLYPKKWQEIPQHLGRPNVQSSPRVS